MDKIGRIYVEDDDRDTEFPPEVSNSVPQHPPRLLHHQRHGVRLPWSQAAPEADGYEEDLLYDIFIDLHKAYYKLYHGLCPKILGAYDVAP